MTENIAVVTLFASFLVFKTGDLKDLRRLLSQQYQSSQHFSFEILCKARVNNWLSKVGVPAMLWRLQMPYIFLMTFPYNLAQRYYIHEVKSIELTARLILGQGKPGAIY